MGFVRALLDNRPDCLFCSMMAESCIVFFREFRFSANISGFFGGFFYKSAKFGILILSKKRVDFSAFIFEAYGNSFVKNRISVGFSSFFLIFSLVISFGFP